MERGEALIKVGACGLSKTDVEISAGSLTSEGYEIRPPLILGHEVSGEIARIEGDPHEFHEGQRVSVAPISACGQCHYCRRGEIQNCKNSEKLGITRNGGLAEFVAAPLQTLYPLPDNLSYEEAALIDTLSKPVYAHLKARFDMGSSVAIWGAGDVAFCYVQVAKYAGATPVIELSWADEKLEMAKRLGADVTINAKKHDSAQKVREFTGGEGADLAVVAVFVDVAEHTKEVLSMVRPGGKVILQGVPETPVDIKSIVTKGITVFGVNGQDYQTSINLTSWGRVDLKSMISHRFSLHEVGKAFEMLQVKGPPFITKAVVLPNR